MEEGKKEERKNIDLLLIDYRFPENRDHSCLVSLEPKATEAVRTVLGIL